MEVRLWDTPVIETNMKEYARVMNETAKRSEPYALELYTEVWGNISPKDAYKLTKEAYGGVDIFDKKTGERTPEGLELFKKSLIKMFGNKKDITKITVRDYIKQTVKMFRL